MKSSSSLSEDEDAEDEEEQPSSWGERAHLPLTMLSARHSTRTANRLSVPIAQRRAICCCNNRQHQPVAVTTDWQCTFHFYGSHAGKFKLL